MYAPIAPSGGRGRNQKRPREIHPVAARMNNKNSLKKDKKRKFRIVG
jgi:hypothetical protein